MDRVPHNRNDTPPPKKRPRFHPPGFESSFHTTVNPSKKQPHRTHASIRADISIHSHEFSPAVHTVGRSNNKTITPGGPVVVNPSHNVGPALSDDEELAAAAAEIDNVPQQQQHHHHHHQQQQQSSSPSSSRPPRFLHRQKKRVSASFSEFTSAFDMPTKKEKEKKKQKRKIFFSQTELAKVSPSHTVLTTEDDDTRRRESGLVVGANTTTPRTPMRLLKPPSLLREVVVANNHSISKNQSPLNNKASYPHDNASTSDTKINSMMSHLPFLKGTATLLASPQCGAAIAVDGRKLVSLAPPSLQPETLQNRHEKTKTAHASPRVSHERRAEILASSVRVSRKHTPANVELMELARGVEISPQKGIRGQEKRLIQGGLAERAERLLSRSSTNFSLWQAGFVKQLESGGGKHTKEDIRLCITSVLSFTRNHSRSCTSSMDALPRTAIARCRKVLLCEGKRREEEEEEERTVVFLFSNHERVSSVVGFEEGKDVCVWRPWREIEFASSSSSEVVVRDEKDWEERPFVFSSSSPSAGKRTALLCSRFVVMV